MSLFTGHICDENGCVLDVFVYRLDFILVHYKILVHFFFVSMFRFTIIFNVLRHVIQICTVQSIKMYLAVLPALVKVFSLHMII